MPRIHKNPTCPPGRPIVSGINSITSRIGKYIDFYLQPIVSKTPSFLKDTSSTIKRLEEIQLQKGFIMATADVASLYTCIPHERGIEAVRHFLYREESLAPFQCDYLIELLEFATKHNYFWFDQRYYLQQRGVAMGAKFALSLANLFMAKWEEYSRIIETILRTS